MSLATIHYYTKLQNSFFLVLRTFRTYRWQLSTMHYNIIDYRHYAVHYIPIISLFYNWKLLPLDPFTHFARPSNSLPSSNHLSFLCIYEFCEGFLFLF